ncbi:hypothetical protein DL93DRAFT_2097267 [Clavulina sp. PMI_390]|nr:hypothetical protein DL93DRAFT_2097267 [Clavulina sp. PMI_390]
MADSCATSCVEICCGGCCIAIVEAIQQWCYLKPSGGASRNRGSGCCHGLGGFDETGEDEFDRMTRADREREQKQKTGQQPAANEEAGTVKATQPAPAPEMNVSTPAPAPTTAPAEISEKTS